MTKILSIRPNIHIMSLLYEIRNHLPDTNRTEIINLAITKAKSKNVDWKIISKSSYKIHQNLEMPTFMQIKTTQESYDTIYNAILNSFKDQGLKRVTAPFLVKLVLIYYLSLLIEEPKKENTLNPIMKKIREWKEYNKNSPKCPYSGNEIIHDIYRALNDSDCQLTKGNLMADTIFSLWIPLKMSLQCSETYPYRLQGNKFYPYKHDNYISKSGNLINFLTDIEENLEIYLPENKWGRLYEFAALSLTRANIMILHDRKMQSRGKLFLDQMPKTLYECFKDGVFYECFQKKDSLVTNWIKEEKLEYFFDGEIKRENIKPLIKNFKADEVYWLKEKEDIDEMLKNFINVLKLRGKEL